MIKDEQILIRQLKQSEVSGVLKQLVERQKRKCAICNEGFTPRDNAVLDHCHDTGFIRGAIHRSCNGAEGKVKTKGHLGHKGVSSRDFIIGLGEYLKEHKTPKYQLIYPTHMTEEQKRLARNKKARELRKRNKTA